VLSGAGRDCLVIGDGPSFSLYGIGLGLPSSFCSIIYFTIGWIIFQTIANRLIV